MVESHLPTVPYPCGAGSAGAINVLLTRHKRVFFMGATLSSGVCDTRFSGCRDPGRVLTRTGPIAQTARRGRSFRSSVQTRPDRLRQEDLPEHEARVVAARIACLRLDHDDPPLTLGLHREKPPQPFTPGMRPAGTVIAPGMGHGSAQAADGAVTTVISRRSAVRKKLAERVPVRLRPGRRSALLRPVARRSSAGPRAGRGCRCRRAGWRRAGRSG